jgi:hypothetical protein
MKKILLIFQLTFLSQYIFSQINFPQSFEDYHFPPSSSKSATVGDLYSPYGIAVTPKGDLKVLIICVGFGAPYDNYLLDGWDTGSNSFPNWVNNKSSFYSSYNDFNSTASINDKGNLSRFYYEMSKGTFRIIANVYPTRININPTGAASWYDLNRKVIEKMKTDDPTFNWAPYDNRENYPAFMKDNSISSADNKPDFIVIVYRYDNGKRDHTLNWYIAPPVPDDPSTPEYNEAMYNWSGSGGGFASIGGFDGIYNGYSFNSACGYTHCLGTSGLYSLFIHEAAHNIFDCPHYADANGVVGNYFYNQIGGWGMMNLGSGPFGCANGWERWYLGWSELISNSVQSDIKSSIDLPNNGEFTLRDFITTGDVVRIKIPNGTGVDQYLWLENHKGLSIFDDRAWGGLDGCSGTLPSSARGLVAYIESIDGNRNDPFSFWSDSYTANGIKPIHSKGNYDYTFTGSPEYPCNLWGNVIYNIVEGLPNPLSGNNRTEGIRLDYNNDGEIHLNQFINSSTDKNETHWVAKRNGNMTYDFMGSDINFSVGQKLGMSTNPALVNRPVLTNSSVPLKETLSPIFLNGISVIVYSKETNGDIKVRISYNDVAITSDLRWTGNIILPDITGNSSPDLNLYPNTTLIMNKSGTSNRHTKTSWGDFINPTMFTCSQNSFLKMQNNSKIIIDQLSSFILESGSSIEINDGAVITVKNGSTFQVKSGANIIIKGSGRLDIESGAYICIESDANINLQDVKSKINLHNGYFLGVNTSVMTNLGTCINSASSIAYIGNGSITVFSNTDKYIQNQTYTTTNYITGNNFYVGSSVIPSSSVPQGPVILKSPSNVVFDADGTIFFYPTFEVQTGSTFEAR